MPDFTKDGGAWYAPDSRRPNTITYSDRPPLRGLKPSQETTDIQNEQKMENTLDSMRQSYEHMMGSAQPAHMGSQSSAPGKEEVPGPEGKGK